MKSIMTGNYIDFHRKSKWSAFDGDTQKIRHGCGLVVTDFQSPEFFEIIADDDAIQGAGG
jgi:hypothetical protein